MAKYLKLFDEHSDYNTYITGNDKILPNVSHCIDNNDVHYNPWTDPRLILTYTVEDDSEPTYLYDYNDEVYAVNIFNKIEIDNIEISPQVLDEAEGCYQLSEGEHTVKYTLIDPTTIDEWVFCECSRLTSISIPSSVTSISDSTFYGCSSLESITIDSNNTTYDSRNNCNAIIQTSNNALFYGCKTTIIPNTVTAISDYSFQYCTGLTSITIPNSVTSIGESVFDGCSGLTSITIPNSVTTIGRNAFRGCSNLVNITSLCSTAPTITANTFRDVKTGGTLTVPIGSTGYDTWMGTGNYYLGKYSWTKVEQ